MDSPLDKPFERPIEFARAMLEESTFTLPELPVGPTPEPTPKPKATGEQRAAAPVESPASFMPPSETDPPPVFHPLSIDSPDRPISTTSTEPAMELGMDSPLSPDELELPTVNLPREMETPLESPVGFGIDDTVLPQVAARSPRDPELNVKVPQIPPEADRFIPELETPPQPTPDAPQVRAGESPFSSLAVNLPEFFNDKPLPPPTEPGFVDPELKPPEIRTLSQADFAAAFAPLPPLQGGYTPKPEPKFEDASDADYRINERIARESFFINLGRD